MRHKEVLPFVTWVDFEAIRLSEISQIEKGKNCMICYMWNLNNKNDKTCSQKRLVVARGRGRG